MLPMKSLTDRPGSMLINFSSPMFWARLTGFGMLNPETELKVTRRRTALKRSFIVSVVRGKKKKNLVRERRF